MAGGIWKPVFLSRRATEDLGQEVGGEVACDEEDGGPGEVAEGFVDGEEAEVED